MQLQVPTDPPLPRSTSEAALSLQEQTYLLLKEMIADGRIAAGERLMEGQVATAFGISRSPARHALSMLSDDCLVASAGKRGFVVAGNSKAPAEGRMAALAPIKLSVPRQWETMYKEVEQDLFVRVLFGSFRINEARLAQHFNVSRTVTRDLLAHMHGVGIIVKDDAGHWVAQQITPERIGHLYKLRSLLEPQALLDAAPLLPASLLKNARENILAALAVLPIESAHFDRIEHELHVETLSYSPNTEIRNALSRTHLLFGPTRYLNNPFLGIPVEPLQDALREHLQIFDLLIAGQPEAAANKLREHIELAVDRWLRRFRITSGIADFQLPPYLAPVAPAAPAAPAAGHA